MNELALFAGGGGGLLASRILGWNTIAAVEIEEFPRECLLQRQRDGALDPFPIWDDVCSFDGKPFKGLVSIVSGGFPCQDISKAGKGLGVSSGSRSGLWKEYARILDEVKPGLVFAENSPQLTSRGLDIVLRDLSELGYDAIWCVLGARHIGACHKRDRIWILAYNSSGVRFQALGLAGRKFVPITQHRQLDGARNAFVPVDRDSEISRDPDALATWVDRLRATGNGQVPQVAVAAFCLLANSLNQIGVIE